MIFRKIASAAGCIRGVMQAHWTFRALATLNRTTGKTRLNPAYMNIGKIQH